jgi:hypothetical protein
MSDELKVESNELKVNTSSEFLISPSMTSP